MDSTATTTTTTTQQVAAGLDDRSRRPLMPSNSKQRSAKTRRTRARRQVGLVALFEACKQWFHKIDIGVPRGSDGRADFSRDPPESFKRIGDVMSTVRARKPSSVFELVWAVLIVSFIRFPWTLTMLGVASLMAACASAMQPKLLQVALDTGVQLLDDTAQSLSHSSTSHVLYWQIVLAVVLCVVCDWLSSIICVIAGGVLHFVTTQIEDSWRYAGARHFFSLPMAWHNNHDSAAVTARIQRGGLSIWQLLYGALGQQVFENLLRIVSITVSAIYTAPHLWWVFLLPLPLFALLVRVSDLLLSDMGRQLRKSYRVSCAVLHDMTGNKHIVKSFGCEERETRRYASFWGAYNADEFAETLVHYVRDAVQRGCELCLRTLLVCLCLRDLINGSMSVGTVAMLLSYQRMLFDPLMSFNRMLVQVARDMRKLGDLVKLLLVDDPLADKPDSVDLPALRHAITLKNVVFRYAADLPPPSSSSDNEGDQQAEASDNSNSSDTDTDSDVDTNNQVGDDNDDDDDEETYSERERKTGISRSPALCAINISIPAGKTTAFVGRSGAGKSTLLQLLLRFFDPTEGSILWDGIDIAMSTRRSIRSRTAVVQQDCSLFNRSIRDNITYGCAEEVDEARVIEAATRANIHHFIETLPLGYDSVVGEKGVRLSGGQKQRLAIARALVLQPSLLILDESTSNLDSESERAIQYAIESLQHQVTQVIVAHRLSTILHADQIVVMDQGSVVGVGTHAELLVTCPEYRSLYVLQHGGDIKLSATTKECSNAVCA